MIANRPRPHCKSCHGTGTTERPSAGTFVEQQLALEIDLVSDEVYDRRIDICSTCPSLSNESTCLHCGCFVEFRARLGYKSCPSPNGTKW